VTRAAVAGGLATEVMEVVEIWLVDLPAVAASLR
jgi:hypothetical protein